MEDRHFDFDKHVNESLSLSKKTRERFADNHKDDDIVTEIGIITLDDAESILMNKIDELGLHLTNIVANIKEGKEVFVEKFNPEEGLSIVMSYPLWEPLRSDRYDADFPSWLGGNPAIRLKIAIYIKDDIVKEIKSLISVRCCSKFIGKDISFTTANLQKRLMDFLYIFEQMHKKRDEYVELLDKKYKSTSQGSSFLMAKSTNPMFTSKQILNTKYVTKFEEVFINGWDKTIETLVKDCGGSVG